MAHEEFYSQEESTPPPPLTPEELASERMLALALAERREANRKALAAAGKRPFSAREARERHLRENPQG